MLEIIIIISVLVVNGLHLKSACECFAGCELVLVVAQSDDDEAARPVF